MNQNPLDSENATYVSTGCVFGSEQWNVVLGIRGKSWEWCNLCDYVISLEMKGPHATTIEQWRDLWTA